jgi:hypothetical protein
MSQPVANINIKPVVYQKDTEGNYIFDTNEQKSILKIGNEVSAFDEYEFLITITEYFNISQSNDVIQEDLKKNLFEITTGLPEDKLIK